MSDSALIHEDPVCKMPVNSLQTYYVSYHEGQSFYFCCSWCKSQFENRPAFYLDPDNARKNKNGAASE